MRINRHQMLMEMAEVAAKRSTCLRRQVGAIIAVDGSPVSVGYAGAPPGFPHCTPETCNADHPCTNTTHAEANAIARAARLGMRIEKAILYSTLSPCDSCAKLILAAGIGMMIFRDQYRISDPIGLLIQGEIPVGSLDFSGKVWIWTANQTGVYQTDSWLRKAV